MSAPAGACVPAGHSVSPVHAAAVPGRSGPGPQFGHNLAARLHAFLATLDDGWPVTRSPWRDVIDRIVLETPSTPQRPPDWKRNPSADRTMRFSIGGDCWVTIRPVG